MSTRNQSRERATRTEQVKGAIDVDDLVVGLGLATLGELHDLTRRRDELRETRVRRLRLRLELLDGAAVVLEALLLGKVLLGHEQHTAHEVGGRHSSRARYGPAQRAP